MKKLYFLVIAMLFATINFAQIIKTVQLENPGTLSSVLTGEELSIVTDLTITGSIDARDFKTMRDLMPVLENIDLSVVNVAEYYGVEGTEGTENTKYFENEIPNNAFKSKSSLSNFKFPESITSIGYFAFSNCSALKQITIPNKTETVKSYSFSGCSNIISINIPSSLLSIEPYAFGWTSGEIIVDTNNPNYSSLDGVLFNKDQTSLIQFPTSKLGIYYMPNTVYNIEFQAFAACKIKMINFSSNLESTGHDAFYFSDSIKTITIPNTIKYIDKGSFSWCRNLTKITISEGVTTIRERAFNWCFSLDSVAIPESVQIIENYAFQGCTKLSAITVFSKTPVDLINSPNVFEFIDKNGCILFVPFGTKTAYQAADQWKDFQNIVEMQTTYEMPLQVEAGGLAALLPQPVRDTLTYLALTGTIDARDFRFMRDYLPMLSNLDIGGVKVLSYTGIEGPLLSYWGNYTYPENSIPEFSFNGKASLETVLLPGEIVSIKEAAFQSCTNLKFIDLPETIIFIGEFAFSQCISLSSVNIPPSTVTIGAYALQDCRILSEISIPQSVINIGSCAFSRCNGLKKINAYSISPISLANSELVFDYIDKATCILYVPFGSKEAYQSADQWKDFQNIAEMEPTYEMPLQVEAGGLAALLPQSVRDTMTYLALKGTIDARDFKTMRDEMPVLATLDLSGVNIIAYSGAEGTSIGGTNSYPKDAIPEFAFFQKFSLTSIVLPSNLTSINQHAYMYCTSLISLIVPVGVTSIGDAAFYRCDNLSSISIPTTVNSIGQGAFGFCRGLTSIHISEGVSSLGDGAYGGCIGLINVDDNNPYYCDIDGVLYNKDQTSIMQCPTSKTGNFDIPNSVTSIGNSAFIGCNGLTTIVIPKGVTSIGSYAFYYCSGLIKIVIPEGVTSIGIGAFSDCSGLETISANSSVPISLSNTYAVFDNINKNTCTIYVPFGSKAAYQVADQWKDFQNIVEMAPEIPLTYVPDDNFEQTLIDLGYDSGILDDHVPTANISGIKSLTLDGKNITDVTGLQDFTSLDYLNLMNNQIKNIDVSKNLKITYLSLYKNQLTALDVSMLSKLEFLILSYNQVKSLDVSSNALLRFLDCGWNPISSLDLSKNTIFESLYCNNTNLSTVEVSANPNLITLNCATNKINTLNLSQNSKLRNLICNYNLLGALNLDNNPELDYLQCSDNQLTILKLSNNSKLTRLYCAQNSISTLDVSNCPLLTNFDCFNNKLTSLNLKNGNNQNMTGPYKGFNARNNPNLFCIQVDDPAFAATYTEWFKDPGASYSVLCTDVCPQHFQTVWEGTSGFDHMNINVIDAKIDGIDLETGDEIGVFDGNLCVGYGKVTQTISQQNILNIKVSKNDGSGNGFTTGREVIYKIWDCNEQSEIIVNNIQCLNIQSNPVTCLPFEAFATVFVKLSAISDICHTLTLKTGWNIISIPNQPQNTDIEYTFKPFIINKSLAKIQDESGNTLEDWGIYGGWKNNIGNVSPTEGYKVKANKNDNFEVCGAPVQYPFAIPLKSGWNIMGYPQRTAYDALKVLKQLIDGGKLVKVQDESGNSIEDWGIYGGMKNNIGDFVPGKGYNIKLNADVTLWINESYTKSSSIQPEVIATNHFKPAFTGNGLDHMNINLVGLPVNILQAGDELAVFDGPNCVGAVVLTNKNIINHSVSIAASAKDNDGMPGFTNGNLITLKLWNSKQNTEYILEPEIVKGSAVFAKHESTFASLEKYTTTGLRRISEFGLTKINCYPNPFNNEIYIEIRLAKESEVKVEVLNQMGQRVRILQTSKMLNSGVHSLTWDATNTGNQKVANGIYHLRIITDGKEIHQKLIYSR